MLSIANGLILRECHAILEVVSQTPILNTTDYIIDMKLTTYSIRFDGRTKELILQALSNLQGQYEKEIAAGNQNETILETYDQLGQVRRGILMSPGEEVETDELQEPNSETIDETPEDMYKSQEGRQS